MRVFFAVLISGLCLGLSQPFYLSQHGLLGLLAFIGYAPVIYLLRDASASRAFKLSFFASVIHFSITFYWIVIACHVFGGISLALSIIILLLLASVVACYIASAFAAAQFLHRRFGFSLFLVVPAAVCAVEYLRNYAFFGGFPWGNVGYGISQVSHYLQSASLIGVYGLVFGVVMVNALLAEFAHARFNVFRINRYRLLAFLFLILAPVLFGLVKLSPGFDIDGRVVKVALLQGNIEQGIKNKSFLHREEILSRYFDLQRQAVASGAELVVWPESALPKALSVDLQQLTLPEAAPVNVVGTVLYDDDAFYNSVLVVDKNQHVFARYHKSHLVPFGEYVPWPFKAIAAQVVPGMGAFRPGTDYKPILSSLDDGTPLRLGLTVCYEGVFPEITRAEAKLGANILVNLTNDAWYGVSSAPYQHLHMYRLRSVETGLPFVRATNTGVSAWVDPHGFVHHATELYTQTVEMADVPLVSKPTLYLMVGDVVAQLSLAFVLFTLVLALVGRDVFSRKRGLAEWVLGASGIALVLFAAWHFADAKAALDESALTKQIFLSMYGFFMLIGAWSGRKFGRKLLIISSCVLMVLTLIIGLGEGYLYFVTSAGAGLVALIAFLRTKAYA